MTYCFNSYNYKLDNSSYEYKIQQEVNKTGKFDDLVYKFKKNGDTKWTRLLIQAKSKDQQNLIRPSNLLSSLNRETFGLAKFLKSTDEIKVDDECEDYYIIYTNAHFDLDSNGMLVECLQNIKQVSLSISKCSFPVFERDCQYMLQENNAEIFHEHDKQVKASEERWTTFLRKLVFVVGQPDLEKIKSVVDSKINNILPNLTEQIRCKLIDITDKSLYKNTEITSQQISKIIEDAKDEIEIYYKKYEETMVEFHSSLPLEDFLISTSTVLPIRSNNSEFTLHKVCKKLKQLREEKPCVNKYTMKHVYSIIQVTDLDNAMLLKQNNLLIFGIETNDELGRFKNIQKNDDQKYILICTKDDLNLSNIPNSFIVHEDKQNSFQMLTDESKNYILEQKCISLNQQKSSFNDILKVNFNDLTQEQVRGLNDVITEDVIKCFFDEDFRALEVSFNRTGINNLDDSYIPRILCCSAMIEEINLKLFKDLYIVDNLNKFKTMCEENPEQNVHHFIKYKKYLLWTQSNGDLTYIRHFIKKYKVTNVLLINECNLFNVYNNVLISDNPGMGKSTLSSSVFNKLQSKHPTNIIIRLNLNDHTNAFNEDPDLSNPESTIDFLNNKLLAEAKSSVISNNILNFILQNKNKIFLLLDGVDEVCPDYKDTVFKFIKSINDLKYISLFVTTRPAQAANLKEILTTFALSIQPFSIQEQISYLNNILDRKNIDTEALLENINKDSKLEEIFGVPLLLKIVAEIINNAEEELNIDETLNLYKIFNTFVNQKFNIYSNEKKKQDTTNTSVRGDDEVLLNDYKRKHEYLAMKLLFSEFKNQEILGETTIDRIIKVGIITQIKDQIPTFTHQTFAEYFASTFIETHLNEEQIIHILFTKVLVWNDLPILRKLLNNYIQLDNEETKQIFSESIEKKYSNVKNDDPLLSILFAAAYEDNLEILNFILDNFSKYPITLEKMLFCHLNNNELIPLQAAIRNGNIEIAKQLITIYIGQIKDSRSDSLAREYLLGKGDTTGNTAIHDAAIAGNKNIVTLLLDKMADINKVNNAGETVLHKATIGCSKDIVSLLLDKGADINKVDIHGETALHKIIPNFHYGTALHMVTYEGHKDIVSLLLDNGADINKVNNDGETVLHKAAIGGSKDIVSLLLDKGADINKMSKYGETVLHKAAIGGSKDIVSLLLDKGADINQVSNDGKTALHMAAFEFHKDVVSLLLDKGAKIITNVHYGTALHMVTCEGHKDIVSLMLDKGVDVNTVDNGGKTALHKAACSGLKDIVNLLLDKGADINKVDEWCETPLFEAAYEGHKDVVNLLLDKGADINNVTTGGVTVLHKAAFGGHKDVVNLLLEKGVDVNKEDNSGKTALHKAAYEGNKSGVNLLHEDYKDVVRLLLDKGADINKVTNCGETALHIAAYHDHKDIVMLLLYKGVNFNKVDTSGKTALHKAVCRGLRDIVKLLLDKGADINIKDNFGETALHEAVRNGNKDIVTLLLDNGGDINKVKNSGETALHKAVCEGRIDLASLLLDRGADTNITSLFFGTALHVAACGGDKNIVSLLLNRGADTNIESLFFGTTLHKAAYGGLEHVVSLLLDKGADINILTLNLGTALNRAAFGGQNYYFNLLLENREDIFRLRFLLEILLANYGGHRDVASLLSNEGAHINKLNLHFGTALHAAAYGGHKNVVSLLLDKGTNIDIKNNGGKTAFHMAAYEGHKDVVSLLLDKGADINIVDNSGETGLHKAGSEGHIDTLIVMLDKGADINNVSLKGFTPLHWAAVCGCTESSRVLLERGADVNITNDYGERALQLAYRTGNYKLVQLFLRHGNDLYDYSNRDSDSDSDGNSDSDSDSVLHAGLLCFVWRRNIKHRLYTTYNDLNAGDSHNRTPLYWAALLGECDIMKVLLSKGADVNIRDINDSTILQAAFRSGNYRAVQLLLRHNNSELYDYYDSDSDSE